MEKTFEFKGFRKALAAVIEGKPVSEAVKVLETEEKPKKTLVSVLEKAQPKETAPVLDAFIFIDGKQMETMRLEGTIAEKVKELQEELKAKDIKSDAVISENSAVVAADGGHVWVIRTKPGK